MNAKHITRSLPASIDGVIFGLIMVLAAFLGRENPYFVYPNILWCFLVFLAFNLLNFSLLTRLMDDQRRMLLSIGANILFVSAAVHYSGGRQSYFWVMYLLPVFHACIAFTRGGVLVITASIIMLLGLLHVGTVPELDLTVMFEFLVKAATVLLSALVVRRTVLGEREANKRLAEGQRTMAQERETARTTLQHMDRLATLGTLTASVAHEINSPLTSILGFAQISMDVRASDEIKKDALRRIESSANRCKKIIQDMLRFSRKEKSERRPADINELIKECVELKRHDWLTDTLHVHEDYDEDLPQVSLLGAEFQQVIFNLLTNAQHAIRDARREDGRIEVRTAGEEEWVTVAISDNGPGIPEKISKKIWEPFFTTKSDNKGTGLGLSISRKIVEAQGGEIAVDTRPGEGAVFTLRFPLEDGARPHLPPAPPSAPPRRSNDKILLAENDHQSANLMRILLINYKRSVDSVETFEQVLAGVREELPALLIISLDMPEMRAYDFLRTLDREGLLEAMDVLVVTGAPLDAATEEYVKLKGFPILAKPFDIKAFHEKVDDFLRR
ncbi:MAG: ATP-binding protein [Elusimicrobiota bacterium]